MRHRKDTFKVGSNGSHRRCLMANMLKSLILNEKIHTSVTKAKELRRYADRMITLAKQNTLASKRRAIAKLMVRYNHLSSKEMREVKNGNTQSYNGDRLVIEKLFNDLGSRFASRNGGYTRIVKGHQRRGDASQQCVIEYLSE